MTLYDLERDAAGKLVALKLVSQSEDGGIFVESAPIEVIIRGFGRGRQQQNAP